MAQDEDKELSARFVPIADSLASKEETILAELNAAQGSPQDIGGYYQPDIDQATAAMRPSPSLNAIIDSI